MRSGTRFCFLVVFALVLMSVPLAAEAGSDSYTLVEIGEGYANAINDRGQVVGSIALPPPGYQRAFVWDAKEGIANLHLALGWDPTLWSQALDINNRGQIIALGLFQPFLVEPNPRSDGFAVTPLTWWLTPPIAINNAGVVVTGELPPTSGTNTAAISRWTMLAMQVTSTTGDRSSASHRTPGIPRYPRRGLLTSSSGSTTGTSLTSLPST